MLIFLEPHAEHFIRVEMNGTGMSLDDGSAAGSASRSWPLSRGSAPNEFSEVEKSNMLSVAVHGPLPFPGTDHESDHGNAVGNVCHCGS